MKIRIAIAIAFSGCLHPPALAEVPPELRPWLKNAQNWVRDTEGPIISLGEEGEFDDRHLFAPTVGWEDEDSSRKFSLWYPGSRGTVKDRVFRAGLATGADGRTFSKHPENPVLSFGDAEERKSVLTPCLIRDELGRPERDDQNRLVLFFSATDFHDPTGLHTLHVVTSDDGVRWSAPSESLLKGCYAPTIVKIGRLWQIWYTDVSSEPWIIRKAESRDGLKWRVHPEPVIALDQAWEKTNLFYPHVIKPGPKHPYLMWYGSYEATNQHHTALGFAASLDGIKWYKHPRNPVFRSDPERPWESHYVTSHSVAVLPRGEKDVDLRIWYASRKAPPFENKYFALNTAIWKSPEPFLGEAAGKMEEVPLRNARWQENKRQKLRKMLGIPDEKTPLESEKRGEIVHDGIVIEKWTFTAEAGSRIPALLYRPEEPASDRLPAIVFTYGHGGSKSAWQYHYAAQLYARYGIACLAIDPLGEEERHAKGRMGTRAHDPYSVHLRAEAAGRLVMGKLVFDTMRAIDFLRDRKDIGKIGVAGNSLGGAVAGWVAALEPRIDTAIVCGWAFDDIALRTKFCTSAPNQRMREICSWSDFLRLMSPAHVIIMNGDADVVIDREGDGSAWEGMRRAQREIPVHRGESALWFEKGGGHRPYFAHPGALRWIERHLGLPGLAHDHLFSTGAINGGAYCDRHGIPLEKLYGTELHQRGSTLASPPHGELIRPLPREKLSVLKPEEIGRPEFTIEGWLDAIEKKGPSPESD